MKNKIPTLCLCAALLCALVLAPQQTRAADEDSQATILSGKVLTTVTRMPPLPFNAIIDEVLVTPGQAVDANAPLLRYHLQEEAQRALQKELILGANRDGARMEDLKAQIAALEGELANAVAERNKARQLASSGLGSGQALHRLEVNVTSLQNRITFTRESIKKANDNFDLRLKELSGYFGQPITPGSTLPSSLVLISPIAGHVLTVASNANPGTLMPAGTMPVSIGNLNPMLIQVQVYEAEVSRIKVGDTAEVEIPSLQNKKVTARVTQIAWASGDMNVANPSFYAVDLSVPNPDLDLKPGFKAIVHFGKR